MQIYIFISHLCILDIHITGQRTRLQYSASKTLLGENKIPSCLIVSARVQIQF